MEKKKHQFVKKYNPPKGMKVVSPPSNDAVRQQLHCPETPGSGGCFSTRHQTDVLIRIDDGEEFIKNTNGSYSNAKMLRFREKGHLIGEWSYELLMKSGFKHKDVHESYKSS